MSNTVDGNGITIEVPVDPAPNVASGNDVKTSSEDTRKRGADEVWTDRSALIFDVDDHPPIYIAFAYALQVRPLDNRQFYLYLSCSESIVVPNA